MLHGNIHRHLFILSVVNWVIAVVCWTVSAYLGIAVPTSIFVYAVLFVIGLFAAVVAIVSYVLAEFGAEPEGVIADTATPAPPEAAGGQAASS